MGFCVSLNATNQSYLIPSVNFLFQLFSFFFLSVAAQGFFVLQDYGITLFSRLIIAILLQRYEFPIMVSGGFLI
jgi:hypothetical protein